MSLMSWMEGNIQKMKWYDMSLTKMSVMFFTLFLITIWDAFRVFVLSIEWYWYLVLFVLFALPVMIKMFSK
jgi:hypothetical protein